MMDCHINWKPAYSGDNYWHFKADIGRGQCPDCGSTLETKVGRVLCCKANGHGWLILKRGELGSQEVKEEDWTPEGTCIVALGTDDVMTWIRCYELG